MCEAIALKKTNKTSRLRPPKGSGKHPKRFGMAKGRVGSPPSYIIRGLAVNALSCKKNRRFFLAHPCCSCSAPLHTVGVRRANFFYKKKIRPLVLYPPEPPPQASLRLFFYKKKYGRMPQGRLRVRDQDEGLKITKMIYDIKKIFS